MKSKVTLAVAQMAPKLYRKEDNIARIMEMIDEAAEAGADLVAFPELATTGYVHESMSIEEGKQFLKLSEPIPGPTTTKFSTKAKEDKIYVVIGICEQSGIPGLLYNASVLIGPYGNLVHIYRKTHLPIEEPHYFIPGKELNVSKTEIGCIGTLICADIRLPEPARVLTLKGAQIIVASANWPAQSTEFPLLKYHWDITPNVRAVENGVFFVASNRVGVEKGLTFTGHSKILNPQGKSLVECGKSEEEVKAVEVDLNEVSCSRILSVIVKERKPELYKELI